MRKVNKFLAIILAILMVISIIPITSNAATYSGACGDDLTWIYDSSTYTLTISGTGEMYDYKYNNRPWESYKTKIKNVVVSDDITKIGAYAFYSFSKVESIAIPESISTIGKCAFNGCEKLTSITIPNSVTIIEERTFAYCESLTSITIPKGVTSISEDAFDRCENLTDIIVDSENQYYSSDEYGVLFNNDKTILIQYPIGNTRTSYIVPEGVTTIGDSAFYNCITLTSITLPNGVKAIEDYAFDGCDGLTSIVIPDGVTTIGDWAFGSCDSLESITIPESVTTISGNALTYNTTIVYYGGTANKWKQLLDNNPASQGTYLKELMVFCVDQTVLPSGTCGDNLTWTYDVTTNTLTISGTGAMYDYETDPFDMNDGPWGTYASKIKNIVIEDGVTSIGDYAFYRCEAVESIAIGSDVGSIGSYAFSYCFELKNITVNNNNSYYSNDEYGVLFNKYKTTLVLYPQGNPRESYTVPDSVITIGRLAFDNCDYLNKVVIGKNTKTISSGAFNYSTNLKEIVFSDSVTKIEEWAFDNCDGLESVVIGSGVTYIGDHAFYDCESLISVVIPDSVTTIDDDAFFYCKKLREVSIGVGVKKIGDRAFDYCDSLSIVYYAGTFEQWQAISICIYNQPLTSASIYFKDGELGGLCGENAKWTFDEATGTLTISGTGAMDNDLSSYEGPCYRYTPYIKNIIIEDGITVIGEDAFVNCKNLESVTIPRSVVKIGAAAFNNCSKLTSIVIPDSVTEIGDRAFSCCTSLAGITIPNSVITIGAAAFHECTSLTSVVIPNSVTTLGNSAFQECKGLTSVTISDNITIINYLTFDMCSNLKTVVIGKNVKKIDFQAFARCSALTSISIPHGVTEICKETFLWCTGLETIKIPNSVKTIGETAFNACKSLATVDYRGTKAQWDVISIGRYNEPLNNATIHYNCDIKYSSIATPPTCTERGYTTYTCECGDSYVDDYVDAKGHNHTSEITTPATHTTTGVMTYTCSCGDIYTEVIAKLEKHNYESVVTAPTCTEQGYTTYTCECSDSYVADYVNATGHTEETIPAVAPTCTETGFTEGANCSVCGETLTEQKELPANGHSPANAVEENYIVPSCTGNGSKDVVIYCTECDKEISRETETIEATGHADNDGDGCCDACNEQLEDNNDSQISIMSIIMMIINFILELFGIK